MTNPFAHDDMSNAQGDYNYAFSEDYGVPDIHRENFLRAMDAPGDSLSEEDYRYPSDGTAAGIPAWAP